MACDSGFSLRRPAVGVRERECSLLTSMTRLYALAPEQGLSVKRTFRAAIRARTGSFVISIAFSANYTNPGRRSMNFLGCSATWCIEGIHE